MQAELAYWIALHRKRKDEIGMLAFGVATGIKLAKEYLMPNEIELKAVESGEGVIKNGRFFNIGKTYNKDGSLRFDFDARNAQDPWFNGSSFHGYDDNGCPIWNCPDHSHD